MISDAAEKLFAILGERSLKLAVAESCTTGRIALALSEIPGASKIFWGAFVSYSDDAKRRILGVKEGTLLEKGAASEEVALTMAEGALAASGADFALATTGVAGPEGNGTDVPVGTVWFAVAGRADNHAASSRTACKHYDGNRNEIRDRAAEDALRLAAAFIRNLP